MRPILGAHLVAEARRRSRLRWTSGGGRALCRAITRIHWADAVVTRRERNASAGPRCRHRPTRLSAILATDREGLILLSRDLGFLERVLRPERPREPLRRAPPRQGAPCRARRRAPAGPSGRRHQRRRRRASGGLEPPPPAPRHPAQHHPLRPDHADRPTSDRPSGPREAWLCPVADLARHFPDCPEAIQARRRSPSAARYRIPVGSGWCRPASPMPTTPSQQLRALSLGGRRAALRHHRPGDPRPAGARARHHRPEGVRRLLPGGARHRRARPDPLRPGFGGQLDRELLPRHHPRRAARLRAPVRAVPQPRAQDPPDIDLDFPWDERDNVLAYVFRRYPQPQAAMVANHNTFRPRGALREVAKVHGRPAGEIREVTRRIPSGTSDERLDAAAGRRTPTSRARPARRAGRSCPAGRSRWWAFRAICRSIRRRGDRADPAHRLRPGRAARPRRSMATPIFRCRSSSSRRTAPKMRDW